MDEIIKMLLSVLGGGALVALIGLFGDRLKHRDARRDAKEDREAAKQDRSTENSRQISAMQEEEKERNDALEDRLREIEQQIKNRSTATQDQIGALTDAIRLILYDRLIQFGEYLVGKGEVTFDQRHRFGQMYDEYHTVLKGNGDADFLRDAVNKLPMKYSEGEKPSY